MVSSAGASAASSVVVSSTASVSTTSVSAAFSSAAGASSTGAEAEVAEEAALSEPVSALSALEQAARPNTVAAAMVQAAMVFFMVFLPHGRDDSRASRSARSRLPREWGVRRGGPSSAPPLR